MRIYIDLSDEEAEKLIRKQYKCSYAHVEMRDGNMYLKMLDDLPKIHSCTFQLTMGEECANFESETPEAATSGESRN